MLRFFLEDTEIRDEIFHIGMIPHPPFSKKSGKKSAHFEY